MRNQFGTWFYRGILLLLVGGIVYYIKYPNTDTAVLVTLLLVLANAVSLYQNHQSQREERRSRQRPHAKKVLVSGIGGLRLWINKNRRTEDNIMQRWKYRSYPSFSKQRIPNEFLADIFKSHPKSKSKIKAFIHNYNKYTEKRREVKGNLTEFVESEFRPQSLPSEIQNAVPTYNQEVDTSRIDSSEPPEKLLKEQPRYFAEYVLRNHITTPHIYDGSTLNKYDCCEFVFDECREEFLALRDSEFESEFSELANSYDSLQESRAALYRELTIVRDDYIKKYQILETELRDVESENMEIM
jgi:hypothetical protein